MRVAALQFNIAWEDRGENFKRVLEHADEAAGDGADLLVLPEMFATGFSMNPSITAEVPDGETTEFIRSIARRHQIGVIGGLVLKGKHGRGRNVALAVNRDGRDLAVYTKSHLFSFLDENQHHEAGDGPVPFEFEDVRCACFVCYDLRFPELFRLTADTCDAVFVIASWPSARSRHWDILLPARAVENQQYVIGLNRIGTGGGHLFKGGSAIYSPLGAPLAQGKDREGLLIADIDPEEVAKVRESTPFLRDRRF
ncbi:MAG: carbon-nitrogen family hydrolase [Proteobacteria bacterium]|nr:carbon-nitrogen family hydrolase [Pseudomonadota bacterium]